MDNQKRNVYITPAIVLEIELETRAGSEPVEVPIEPPFFILYNEE